MPITGLTSAEVAERKSQGQVNSVETAVSRTYTDIIVKNVFTTFNVLLFIMGAILLIMQEPINALAATFTIILNIVVATIQEMKAKRRLDKIALLMRPKVNVIRDGQQTEIDQAEIVKDDIIVLRPGDQALVDGEVLEMEFLEMDESLLTGESHSIRKHVGDRVLSGSYCITGKGVYRVDAFGEESFASKMLASAKRYTSKNTPLQIETGAITKLLMMISFSMMLLMFILTVIKNYADVDQLVKTIILNAVIILDIVPIALFLLIVINYMVAAIRMADSGVLLQRSNAVESLSHVDTVCMDKTGTITTNRLIYKEMKSYIQESEAEEIVRIYANATGSKNKTADALLNEFGSCDAVAIDEIRFSSERKFSAIKTMYKGRTVSMYMGAHTSLGPHMDVDVSDVIQDYSKKGLRTVVIALGDDVEFYDGNEPVIPLLRCVAVIAIEDEVRADCRDTIDVFISNGMDIKVISGDDPQTVDALFTIANIPGTRNIISGEELDALKGQEKTDAILRTNIFGRMKPDHKEEVIDTLKKNGRYVAMVGDGVNDVKSLKMANVGVSIESGAGAARGVADMVLLKDNFNALPKALVEGRRTVSGLRDILKFYITRNFAFAVIVLLILFIVGSFMPNGATPFLTTQATFYAFVSVAIASFLMTLWAEPTENNGSILSDVIRYAAPMGILIAVFGFILYMIVFTLSMHGVIDTGYLSDWQIWRYGWPEKSVPEGTDILLRCSEINARNALLLFMVLANITQMLMVVPIFKFLSLDGNLRKDKKPTILVFLLWILVFLVYFAVQLDSSNTLANILPITLISPATSVSIVLYIVAWFFFSLFVMKSGKLNFITDLTEKWYQKRLAKEYAKNKKEDDTDVQDKN